MSWAYVQRGGGRKCGARLMDTLEHIITAPTLLFALMECATRRIVQALNRRTVVDCLTGLIERVLV